MKQRILTCLLMALLTIGATKAYAQLPAVTLKSMDGKTIRTDTLANEGRPFIISFFATWCHPCNRELDAISEVYEEWQEETGVKLFAVSIDEAQNINKVKPLVNNHGWEVDVLNDPNSEFRRACGIQMIPFTILCDGQGKIVYKHNGYNNGDETELIAKVRELLKK